MTEKVEEPAAVTPEEVRGRRTPRLIWNLVICAVLGVGGFNLVARNQARAMLTFAPPQEGRDGLRREQSLMNIIFGVTAYRPENRTTPDGVGLEYATHRTQSRDGTKLELWEIARADPRAVVLLFHGYAASKSSLLPDAKAFHAMGCASYLVDFRGSGGSDGNETTVGFREGMDVAASLEFVRARHPDAKIVLYGRSMGAAAILRAIHAEGIAPDAIVLETVFDRMLTTVGNRFRAMGLPTFPAARTLIFWGSVHAGFWAFDHNPEDYARSVKCPALVMQGDEDQRARTEDAQRVFENLPEGSAWELFTGAEHVSMLNHDEEKWKSAVEKLIKGIAR